MTVTAVDNAGYSGNTTFTWNITNTVTVTNPGPQTNVSGSAITTLVNAATDSSSTATISTWSASGLPAVLSIDAASGQITGTPTTACACSVTVTAVDNVGYTGNTTFTWNVTNTVTVTNPGTQSNVSGSSISTLSMVASDSSSTATISTWSASGLPAGLTIDATSGHITGTPTTACACSVAVQATDSAGFSGTATFTWTITNVVSVTNPGAQSSTTGSAIAGLQIVASDTSSTATLRYLASGLPAALAVDPSSGLITGTPTLACACSVTVTVTDDAGYSATTSFTWTVTVPTTTTMTSTSPPGSTLYGEATTFAFTVTPLTPGSGEPTGPVTVAQGATTICSTTLVGADNGSGSCTGSVLVAPGSGLTFTAAYAGDGTFIGSAGTTTETVNQASTTTTITSTTPSGSVVYGQSTTFAFTVAPVGPGAGIPTGTVTVTQGATTICSTTLLVADGGSGTCTGTVPVTPGIGLTFTATYAGDTNFTGSAGSTTLDVDQGSTTTTITSPAPSGSVVYGQSTTFAFTMAPVGPGAGIPTGTVTVTQGATTICSTTLLVADGGSGTCTGTVPVTPGIGLTFTATYAGDTNFTGSAGTTALDVGASPTSTSITSTTPASPVVGQAVVVSVSVGSVSPGSGTPTGTVAVSDGTRTCLATLVAGAGSCSLTETTAGSYLLNAGYGSDTDFAASSTATPTPVTVGADTTTTTVMSSVDPSASGQPVTFTAHVVAVSPGAGTPTGSVTFSIIPTAGGSVDCSGSDVQTLSGGSASCVVPSALVASGSTYAVTAVYGATANDNGSTGGLTQTVGPAGTATTITVIPSTVVYGHEDTTVFSATVTPTFAGPVPTGTVTVSSGPTTLCVVSLTAGSGSCSTTATMLAAGTHTVTGAYGGNPDLSGSTSSTDAFVVDLAPTITSAAATTFTTGAPGTFTVTTGPDFPTATTLTETSPLPAGVTLLDNGNGTATLSGTPASGTGGTYPVTVVAANGVSPNASQSFVLTVDQAPAFTGPITADAVEGVPYSHTVSTTGFPTPAITGSGLPAWLTLTDNHDGTATLTGTPNQYNVGNTAFTLSATNGVGAGASESFLLNVEDPVAPAFTSNAATTVQVGVPSSFAVTTTGYPAATLTASGTVPAGITFVDNGNGTGALSGTAPPFSDGSYTLFLTATNGSSASQTFVLFIGHPPVITSGSSATFALGTADTFTVTSTAGFPGATTLAEAGSLPSGVTFTDNHNGTATLAGTPAQSAGGVYVLTVTASDLYSSTSQTFRLTVSGPPAFVAPATASFPVGSPGSVTVIAGGWPVPALAETGLLPVGVTFTDNGNGTATIAGTPPGASAGAYPVVLTATGTGPPVTEAYTVDVTQAPVITSPASASFVIGTPGSASVTTSAGFPVSTALSATGTLPPGLAFTDNGNGTGRLSGTPTGGAGTRTVSITASNGAQSTTQYLTVTVDQTPVLGGPSAATFTVGAHGTATVSAVGYPTPSLAETVLLPAGVTFTDNGNGTATVAGVPGGGTGRSYSVTVTATNGIGVPATGPFTLTVTQKPGVTSAASTSFSMGTAGSFVVTATAGFPVVTTVTMSGSLPAGVTFTNNGNGTGTLAGTPATGTAGVYPLTVTATNGAVPATQSFTLTVGQAPAWAGKSLLVTGFGASLLTEAPGASIHISGGLAVNSSSSASVYLGSGASLSATAGFTTGDGSPAAACTGCTSANTSPWPPTVGSTTDPLYWMPSPATGGLTVHSGTSLAGPGIYTQPVAVSSGTVSLATGTYIFDQGVSITGSAVVTTSPGGVLFYVAAGPVTMSSSTSVTLAPMSSGTWQGVALYQARTDGYPMTLGGAGTQTLQGAVYSPAAAVNLAPGGGVTVGSLVAPGVHVVSAGTVTVGPTGPLSAATAFPTNTSFTYTFSFAAYPVPAITEAGAIPAGVTFTDNGNGTATLSGTPALLTILNGPYPLTITASNGVGTPLTESFTLTVAQPPSFVSVGSTTFAYNTADHFQVIVLGQPDDSIVVTGTLPPGVTFVNNGNDTGTLSGTPTARGVYTLGITISNGVGGAVVQTFTLTVA